MYRVLRMIRVWVKGGMMKPRRSWMLSWKDLVIGDQKLGIGE
jgi:hypothetical protein